MSSHRYTCAILVILAGLISTAVAQTGSDPIEFKIKQNTQRLTMYVNSSKILTLEGKQIPRALVNNTELLKVVPLSPNQVQISAIKPGVTQINIWDDNGMIYTIDVVIYGDAKELELLLETEFPTASLRVRPLATSVVLSGYVDRPDVVHRIIKMAEDYYPKVINNMTVGGVQQVMLYVQVMEVSRTKLRKLGFEWEWENMAGDFVSQTLGLRESNITFGIIGDDSQFFGFV
jgi:pilus assembly protein CpaC